MNDFLLWLQSITMGRQRRDAKLLLKSGLFDLQFYMSQVHPREAPSLDHFLDAGWKRGANPSPFFDSEFYLRSHPDVKNAGWNPVIHYIRHGWREGRTPHPSFDIEGYITHHSHVDFKTIDPLQHCIQNYGSIEWKTGDSNHLYDRPAAYSDKALEQDQLDQLFDGDYYNSMYEDVRTSGVDPFLHYSLHGWRENRNPSPEFDTWYFLKSHPEFVSGPDSPLHQYIRAGMPRTWKLRRPNSITLDPSREYKESHLSLAIHVHAFYPDYIEEMYHALTRIRAPFDLFVTTCSQANERFIFCYLTRRSAQFRFNIRVVENRGRDIGPMLTAFPEIWTQYDVVAHLHSKKSPHTGFGDDWRKYTLEQMFGSPELVESIISFLGENKDVGFLFPDNYRLIKGHMDSKRNAGLIDSILVRAHFPQVALPEIAEFAAGSMAWFRTSAFRALADTFSTVDDFEMEEGQIDTTIAHAMEHAFPLVARAQGFRAVCYYSRRRPHLPPIERQHPSVPPPQCAGRNWMRDEPRIAGRRRVSLEPISQVFDARRLDIHWVIPYFGRGAGGHMTIFRFVEILERLGHRQTIWIQDAVGTPAEAKARIQDWYRPIKGNVFVSCLPDDTRQMTGDVIIATDCWTVYPVVSAPNFKERFYFVQDFEPYFHPVGESYFVAEQTYRMGLCGLCAGDWLLQKMQGFGMWVRKWDLAVDNEFYVSGKSRESSYSRDDEFRIAFYSRGYTPRRAKRLGIAAFEELQRRGIRFRVVMFGEEPTTDMFSFKHEERGILSPEQLAKVYHESDIGVVFSATNYSLVPLEMMACDLPVVEIDSESTRAVFKNGEVSFAAPEPTKIADSMEQLLGDAKLRARQVQTAGDFVRPLNWEISARVVEAAILERLVERGFQAILPEQICAPALHHKPLVSVFVPTFNAGSRLKTVLGRLTNQEAPFKYDILVIDSGSSDETLDVIHSFKLKDVRLLEIPNKEFQHGRTRNLGIGATDGDYVAILTQDATPCDHLWLKKLIAGFKVSPRVGGVIGRHKAYPEHDRFVARDLNIMFDRLADFGSLYCLDQGLPSFIYPAGAPWQMTLQFYSDNNSAIARAVWKVLPYPEIDWGEDQVWAWEMLRAGFHKAYVDDAIVFHSHKYTPQQRYDVAIEEGKLFSKYFGWNFHPDAQFHRAEIERLDICDFEYAVAHGISHKQVKERQRLNKATVEGRGRGAMIASRY